MHSVSGCLFAALIGALGLCLIFRTRAILDWLIAFYGRPDIASHLRMPGFDVTLRFIGVGLVLFAGWDAASLLGISN